MTHPHLAPQRTLEEMSVEELRSLVRRSEATLDAVDAGVYVLDLEGNTVYVNEAGARLLGYSARELLGQPQHALVHHHYADGTPFPKEQCPIYSAFTEGITQRVGGDTFWKRDGSALPVDYVAIPIREKRQLTGAVVTFRDATEQQQRQIIAERDKALAEAHAAQRQLLSVFEQAPAAISITMGPEHRFASVNEQARRLTGNRQLIGLTLREAFPEFVEQGLIAQFDQAYASGEPFVGRGVPIRWDRDGSGTLVESVFDFVYQPLRDANDKVYGIFSHAVETGATHRAGAA